MMNRLILLAVCVLFVLSEAIRLETIAQTLGVLQQAGAFEDFKDHYEFDVTLSVRVPTSNYNKRDDRDLWKVHGAWEPPGSVLPEHLADRRTKVIDTPYTAAWSAAVATYNTDADPKHKAGEILKRVSEKKVIMPDADEHVLAALTTELGKWTLVKSEYRNHGYYLPIPTEGFFEILLSEKMTTLKAGCAEAATQLQGLPLNPPYPEITVGKTIYMFSNRNGFIDCMVNARVSVDKATKVPTVVLPA